MVFSQLYIANLSVSPFQIHINFKQKQLSISAITIDEYCLQTVKVITSEAILVVVN